MAKTPTLYVCTKGKKCPDRGGKDILKELRRCAEASGSNIEVEKSGCLKLCKFGPSILAEPGEIEYGEVTIGDCKTIIESHAEGKTVEKLVIQRKKKKK